MVKAAQAAAAGAANGGNTEIGKVVKVTGATAAKGGDATSVNGIASGIKGIVTAAEKAGKEGKLESEEVAGAGEANADAGKLFAKKKANDGGGDAAAAEKAGKEGKLESEEVAGAGDGNEDAGKLFAKKKNDAANGGGDAAAAEKAAAAVSAVSGKQILKAIVDAAEKAGAGVEDVKDAKNPIDAAIGSTGENKNAAAFDKMKKNDQIAAAIVLRGMAKDGEFALKNADAANAEKGLKSTVESAVNKTVSGWLEEMVKAAQTAATAASGGKEDMIGKVVKVNAAAAKGGEEKSVNGIAGGIKGIVAAAEKAGEEGKLKSEAAAGEANADAGKLFATKKKADEADGGGAGDAEKAAAAVSAVSGKQILKAIVDAAGKAGEKKGVDDVKDATNPIDAAIGSTGDNKTAAAFNKMKKNDQIAAAIVLRGMAKDGEFALKNDDAANAEKGLKSTVESAVNKTVSGWLEEMVKAATEAATAASGGNTEMIGKVVKVNAAAAKGGEEKSVNGIASGIKGIVEAAEKAGEEGKLESEAAAGGNENAGKLFAAKKKDEGGGAGDAEKAAAAVSAVSGKQILKAIVDAAKGEEKKGVADVKEATNPIDAAIGSTGGDKAAAAFSKDGMKKNDQIAAAIVLRGMAKDGEFALKNNANNAEKGLKSTVESAVNKTLCRGMVRRDGKSCY